MRSIFFYISLLLCLSVNAQSMATDSLMVPKSMHEINSADDDYWPTISADNQFFATTVSRRNDASNRGSQEDLVIFQRDVKGKWQNDSTLTAALNTLANEGSPAFSADGHYLFFVATDRQGGYGSCDIYYAIRHGNGWSRVIHPEAPLNTRFWESNPSLSVDGKTLYFSSNRPGGIGGMDIWKCSVQVQADGLLRFYNAENMGNVINTPKNESSPFIHPDNETLYFSSDGLLGLGRNDIFLSRKDVAGQWQKPLNLGAPINTSGDDAGFMVEADGTHGYFSSNGIEQNGQGRDIYRIALPESIRPNAVKCLYGSAVEADDQSPVRAKIELTDLLSGKTINMVMADAETGKFSICYPAKGKFGVTVSGRALLYETIAITDTTRQVDVTLHKAIAGQKITLRNIYFAFNSFQLQPESMPELNRLGRFLIEYPSVKIEIAGHTDNTGTEKYNQELSEKRAKAVVDYLISGNIAAERLSYRGYGASQPIATNNTEQGKALNRRTEAILK